MKILKSISSGIRSVAKLIILLLLSTCVSFAADAPPLAPIVGVWMTHFGNGTNRVYRIHEDGSLSYEQPAPADAKSSKIEVINGELTADFGNRLSLFYKPTGDQMNVATFASRANFDANRPVTTGKAYRAIASNSNDPVIGTWKWLLDEQRNMDGILEFKADGTFMMVGTPKMGLWKLSGDRSYVLNWIGIGSEDTMALSADRNGISGKNKSGRLVFGERMQVVAANSIAPATAASAPPPPTIPAAPPTPIAPARPAVAEPKPVIHSIEEILASIDTTKSLKPYDRVDFDIIHQMDMDLRGNEGREIEIEIQPARTPFRNTETQFRWQLAPVKSGTSVFTPSLTVSVFRDDVAAAVAIVPGKPATLHGVIQRCTVGYSNGPTLYVTIQESSLKAKDGVVQQAPLPAQPMSPNTAPQSVMELKKSIQLDRGWDTPMQGGSQTLNDLARLFGSLAKPNTDLTTAIDAPIYDQITYLMPARQAIESLKLNVRVPSRVLIACPGFPRGSLYYYAIDGRFEGYNRMYLVVDRADQVVSVELVNETSAKADVRGKGDPSWHTYDFVNARSRALNTLRVDHHVALWTSAFTHP